MIRKRPGGVHFFLALALGIIWQAAAARSTVIDDSASQALEPRVAMRWRTPVPGRLHRADDDLQIGTLHVLVRLNLSPWLHRSGRIYLNLPAQPPGPIDLSWTTQGRLASGQLHSGERLLVYSGAVTQPFTEELFTFQFAIDGALLDAVTSVTYRFEFDED